MKKFLQLVCVLLITSFSARSQTGEIQGRVLDDKGEPVPYALIVVIRDMVGKEMTSKGTKADVNGRFTLKGMNPGTYNLMAKAVGKPNQIEIGVQVYAGRPVTLDFTMELKSNTKKEVTIIDRRKVKPPKLIDVFKPKETVLSAEDVKDQSVRDIGTIAASTSGVAQADVGAALNVGGGRGDGLVYFVDGVKQTGSPNVPANQIEQLEVIASGVPAKYGDANSGVISIITKGPADKLMGSIEGLTSQFLDPYAYKLANFSLRGPLIRRKSTIDSLNPNSPIKIKGESILGFSIGGEYEYTGDFSPSAVGNWKVKDDSLKQIMQTPYILSDDRKQLLLSQSFINKDDLEPISAHQNTSGRTIRFNAKLDWKVIPNSTNITVGFRGEDNEYNSYIPRYSLLNYQNNPIYRNKSYNGYVRLYQPLFNSDKQVKKAIKNTTLSLQFDATFSGQDFKSPIAGDKPWYYGYIGKFEESREFSYERKSDNDGSKVYYAPNQFLTFTDFVTANSSSSSSVRYTPGTVNPVAAEQTKAFIDLYNSTVGLGEAGKLRSVNAVENAGGIVNGLRANVTIHDLFFPSARIFNGLQKQDNTQFRVTGAINFDIQPSKNKSGSMNKHTIEAGFELEQRINSVYNSNPLTLWSTAQSALLNTHLSSDNKNNFNPLLIMRGGSVRMRLQDYMKQDSISFAAFDTLLYDKEVSNGAMSNFSRNLRNDLFGGDSLSRINIHALDPDAMKLEWFSADELNSFGLANGEGYDSYGNKLGTGTSFNDFFTKKDNKGNFLRHVAAFMPRYAAGYIQDRFQLKSLALNVGMRIDYFDPNTNTLIDPYVPQGGRTIDMVDKVNNVNVQHPSNLPSNAVVYVDRAVGPSRITGYRVGNQWYSKTGSELPGPNAIEIETGSNVQPYLIGDTREEREKRDMGSSTFDPTLMFKNAPSSFAFAPRINFSFEIDSFALLFAHYDVLNQRPEQFYNYANSLDYYNLIQRRNSGFINNPSLGFSSTTDLELGFKQRLNSRSTLTINFIYREFSGQSVVNRLAGAYPGAYNTIGNTDFSTMKSIGFAYEQRRVKNLKLRANYNMQFAEGTSSSATSQLNMIAAGLGNLRVIYPLNWDQRHTLNFTANYRFDSRDPYNKGVPSILKDFGANINFTLYSGRPFTQQLYPTSTASMSSVNRSINVGDVNAAGMPWVFNSSLKFDKDFSFKFGRQDSSKGPDSRPSINLNVYLQVTNIFDMRNVLSVYRYTGDPTTDGYLTSGEGVLEYNSKESIALNYGRAFRDLYNIALELPQNGGSNFVRPRVIQLGAVMSF